MLSGDGPSDSSAVREALLDPFADEAGLVLAVSGGPDSMALLRLAELWRRTGSRPPLFVATVYHGLRAGSRAEAEQVGAWCRDLRLPHEILVWTGEKPAARIQERARSARYGLLEEAARANGASCLLTAHHADDQAETVLFRFLRGSNVAGLAGMPARRRLGGVLHARPFLSIRKRDLEAYCERLGQAWLRDPSNEDARFARARLRAASAALAANGFAPPDLLRLARRAARSEAALRAAYATFSREVGAQEGPGRRIGRDVLEAAPEEFVIRWIVDSVSGLTGASPRLEQVESLVDDVRGALDRSARIRRTLGGVMCDLSWNEFALAPESPRRTEASSPSRRGDPCV